MKSFKKLLLIMLSIGVIVMSIMLTSCGKCKHSWGEWEPTGVVYCDGGEEARVCSECGERETRSTGGDYSLHEWTEWKDVTSVSCTENGEATRSCTKCPKIENKILEKTGHSETLICEICNLPTAPLPEFDANEYKSLGFKITDYQLSIVDNIRIEDSSTASMLEMFSAYIALDENDELIGYGHGIIKTVGTNTGVENEQEIALYIKDGYIYLLDEGSSDANSTLSDFSAQRIALAPDELSQLEELYTAYEDTILAVEDWYTNVLSPIFADVTVGKCPDSLKSFITNAINSVYVREANDDGSITYTLSFEAYYELIDTLCDSPISSYLDAILGEGTYEEIEGLLTSDEFYAYDFADLLNYIQVDQGIDLEALFEALDALAVIVLESEDATFETLLGLVSGQPLPEGLDIYETITSEELAKMTVMDGILMATGAPSVDDPETVEVNEREESEKAIREMVSFYAQMLKESSIVELNMDPSIEEDERAEYIEKAREDAKAQIAEIEKLFSYAITFDKDGNATASFEIKVEDETTIEVVITDVITIYVLDTSDDSSGNVTAVITPNETVEINAEVVERITSLYENEYTVTLDDVKDYFEKLYGSSYKYIITDDGLIKIDINNYHSEEIENDTENSTYNIYLSVEKITADYSELKVAPICGGLYAYRASMKLFETDESTVSYTVVAPKDLDGIGLREYIELDNLNCTFKNMTNRTTSVYFSIVDGKFIPADGNLFNTYGHNFELNEELSKENDGSCTNIYYNYYECTECDYSYKSFHTNGHDLTPVYSYENGKYYAKNKCLNCDEYTDNYLWTITVDSVLDYEYYEDTSYAGFSITIDEATAGKYTVYSAAASDNSIDTYLTVYKLENGELTFIESKDYNGDDDHFLLDIELESGTTYVFAPQKYGSTKLYNSADVTVYLVPCEE